MYVSMYVCMDFIEVLLEAPLKTPLETAAPRRLYTPLEILIETPWRLSRATAFHLVNTISNEMIAFRHILKHVVRIWWSFRWRFNHFNKAAGSPEWLSFILMQMCILSLKSQWVFTHTTSERPQLVIMQGLSGRGRQRARSSAVEVVSVQHNVF